MKETRGSFRCTDGNVTGTWKRKRKRTNKMQETREMKKKEKEYLDSDSALQLSLDRIRINCIPGIVNSDVLELKTGDTVNDAIQLLYEKDVLGAPIVDVVSPDTRISRSSYNYIGFIDLAGMVLWSHKQFERAADNVQTKGCDSKSGIFTMLEENPQIVQTKIGELAKVYLWDLFFPVNLDSTLFHVLLLFSKHQIKVVPVIEQSNSQVIGFVTQNAVIHLLLQSSGLEWFDSIADKALSEFRFETEKQVTQAYGDQSLAEALHLLLKSQIGLIPVLNRATKRLFGSIRSYDIYLLLENDNIFDNRKSIIAEEFIRMETDKSKSDSTIQQDVGSLLLAGILRLRNNFLPEMNSPVTSKRSDSLKQLMTKMADKNSNFSFIVHDLQQVTGVVSSRDVIVQFAPPCIDSSIHGGGSFDYWNRLAAMSKMEP